MTVFLFPHHDNFHHAITRKHKVGSLCSIGNLFAALNRTNSAANSRSPFTMIIPARGRRRSCWRWRLTPPLRQHRPAIVGLRCAPVASPCLPGQNTRAVIFKAAPFSDSPKGTPENGFPPSPRAGGRCGTHRTRRPGSLRYNCVLCSIRLPRCHADCDSAPSHSCGQSPRQLAGILHANAAAPHVPRPSDGRGWPEAG